MRDPYEIITRRKGPMRTWARWVAGLLLLPFFALYFVVLWGFAGMSVVIFEKDERKKSR